MTMKPATAMLQAHVRLVRQGRIKPRAMEYARQQKLTEDEVGAAVGRVRERRALLEIQSAPAKYRRSEDPCHEGEPTPEWRAKARGHIETRQTGSDTRIKGYRIRHVVEQHAEKYSIEKRCAIERYMQDSQHHEHVNISDWNRSGGSSPGSNLGGLGNVPQTIREGHERFEWITARLDTGSYQVAAYLVLRLLNKPDGTPFSLDDFGQVMFPMIRNRDSLKWAGAGAVWSFGAKLVWLYQQPDCPRVQRITDDEREIEWDIKQRKLEG